MKDILKGWGISSEEARISEIGATITIRLKYPAIEDLISIKPEERKMRIREIYKNQYLAFKNDFKVNRLQIIGRKLEPRRLTAETELKTVFKILEKNYVKSLKIEKIEGYTKIEKKTKRRDIFFTVKAKFGIKIEGVEKGLQGWEERFVLLKAKNYQDAKNKAFEILKKSECTYLNSDKRLVWWQFEEILDVYETSIYTLNGFNEDGVEIYSRMHNRRLKSEYVWKPENYD